MHAMPHKPVAHKTLGRVDAQVRQTMEKVKYLVSSVKRNDLVGDAGGDTGMQRDHWEQCYMTLGGSEHPPGILQGQTSDVAALQTKHLRHGGQPERRRNDRRREVA